MESAFGALNQVLTLKKSIEVLTRGKERFGIESTPIAVDSEANLTLFNPATSYTFTKEYIISTSKNTIFENKTLKGKAYGIFANNQLILH